MLVMKDERIDGWERYQELVLSELKRLGEKVDKLDIDFNSMKIKLAGVAAVVGFFSGFFGVVAQWVLTHLKVK